MEEKEIKNLLDEIEIPEPGKEARDKAVRSALAEFRNQKEKKVKGFSWFGRLKGKKYKGGLFMTRPITITAGIAVCIIAFAITLSPQFTAYRMRSTESDETRIISHQKDQIVSDNYIKTEKQAKERPEKLQSVTPDSPISSLKKESEKLQRKIGAVKDRMENVSGYTSTEIAVQKPLIEMNLNNVEAERKKQSGSPKMAALRRERQSSDSLFVSNLSLSQADKVARYTWQNQEYIGRDNFEKIESNPIKLVSEEPVSTFSIDVDTTSYSFVRRALNNGHLPQKNSVRVEEMINYFDYDYPLPKDRTKPFKPTFAVFPTPWNKNTKLLHIGIKGYDIKPDAKPQSNLVFLIDVSGSMNSQDKLPLLKNSLRMLVDTLDPDDTVAMVVYAGAAGTVLDKTKIKEKGKILAALDRLKAGGSTAGGEGIRLAYSLAESNMDPKALNRVILATDGDFNVGIRDPEVLKDFVERKRNKNIYLSVLGFGQGNYNDALMQKLAQNGNGNAAYIDTLNEARKVLVDEVKGTLFAIAKDVKIQIEFNPSRVAEYRLIGYETRMLKREDFNNDQVDAGDIGSGHSVTALYEITPLESEARLIDDLRYGTERNTAIDKGKGKSSEYAFLKIRYKLPDETSSKLITTPIDSNHDYSSISNSPKESRFAAAVAAFGQLLKGGSHMGQFNYDDVIELARGARGDDSFGYRSEFLNLVRLAKTATAMGDR